jgi:hypothetical protein
MAPVGLDVKQDARVARLMTLYQTDPEAEGPVEAPTAVHEYLLEFDPSGSEMRPRT